MASTWISEFKSNAIFRLDENMRMTSIALSKIGEEEIWTRQNRVLNPIGNQMLHIVGNMTQYIVSGLGGKADERIRDQEFNAEGGFTSDELIQRLLLTVQNATQIIQEASGETFIKMYNVQGFTFSGIGLVLHGVEHFSYHVGQIALQVKLVIDEPLGFYAGLNLSARNVPVTQDLEDINKEKSALGDEGLETTVSS